MPVGQFEYELFTTREQAKSSDLVRIGKLTSRHLQELLNKFFALHGTGNGPDGILGGLDVVAGPGTSVNVNPGFGFQTDATGLLTDESAYRVIGVDAVTTLTVAAADPTNPRIDRVEIKHNSEDIESTSVAALDSQGQLISVNVPKRRIARSTVASTTLKIVTGTPAGSPVAPAATAGFVTIGLFRVPAAATASSQYVYFDERRMLTASPRLIGAPFASAFFQRTAVTGGNPQSDFAVTSFLNVNTLAATKRVGIGQFRIELVQAPPALSTDTAATAPSFGVRVTPFHSGAGTHFWCEVRSSVAGPPTTVDVFALDPAGALLEIGANQGFWIEIYLKPPTG